MKERSKKFYLNVGKRIRENRVNQNLSVEQLAELVGISTKYLYQIENGKVSFSAEILYNVALNLDILLDELLDRKSDINTGSNVIKKKLGMFTVEEKSYIRRMIIQDFLGKDINTLDC